MSRNCYLRTFSPYRAALIGIVAVTLLFTCSASPSFSQASSSLQSTVKSERTHAKRQCMDDDAGLQSSVPTQAFQTSPPPTSFSRLALADKPFLPLQSKGFHYNRPPPLS